MNKIIKRLIDMFISAVAIIVLLPILIIIALAIVIESKGSPLFFQNRVGKNGKIFRIIKFRSMVKNASEIGTAWTQAGDKRITKVGKFIRKTSLDELPQLWNVLVGDMSIVGPRPFLAPDEALYTPEQWKIRHSVPVGITGLAQVNGRSKQSLEQQISYDCEYAKNWSIVEDFSIIFKTALIVIQLKDVN